MEILGGKRLRYSFCWENVYVLKMFKMISATHNVGVDKCWR